MSTVNFIYLSHEDVIKSGGLDMLKTISDVDDVLITRQKGECIVPHKVVDYPEFIQNRNAIGYHGRNHHIRHENRSRGGNCM